jgi:hypothetical protein
MSKLIIYAQISPRFILVSHARFGLISAVKILSGSDEPERAAA